MSVARVQYTKEIQPNKAPTDIHIASQSPLNASGQFLYFDTGHAIAEENNEGGFVKKGLSIAF